LSFPETSNFDVLRPESFPFVATTTNPPVTTSTEPPVKVPDTEIPQRTGKLVEVEDPTTLKFRNVEGKQSQLTELDVMEAMETLVERLDNFEIRIDNIENSLLTFELNAVAAEDLSHVKRELDDSMTKLLERNTHLEKQMQFLEEFYRERTNPKSLGNT